MLVGFLVQLVGHLRDMEEVGSSILPEPTWFFGMVSELARDRTFNPARETAFWVRVPAIPPGNDADVAQR